MYLVRPLALYSTYDRSREGFFFYVGGNKNKIPWLTDVGRGKIKKQYCQINLLFSVKIVQFLRKKGQVSGTDFSMSEEEIKKNTEMATFFFLVGHNSSS